MDESFPRRVITNGSHTIRGRVVREQLSVRPGGDAPRPFTYMTEQFLPMLRAASVDEETICRLTHDSPFRAFAR